MRHVRCLLTWSNIRLRKRSKNTAIFKILAVCLICTYGCGPARLARDIMIPNQNMMTPDPYLYSYIDRAGNTVIDVSQFQAAGSFSEGLAPVFSVNQGWGYLDKTGKIIIRPQFAQALGFSEGLAAVELDGKWGFIDKGGRVVIEPQYEYVNSFSEGVAVVEKAITSSKNSEPAKIESQTGPMRLRKSATRQIEIVNRPPVTKSPEPAVEIIDLTGRRINSFDTSEIRLNAHDGARFSEGLIGAFDLKSGKVGFVDKTGHFVIQPQFKEAAPFSEGLARIALDENGKERVGFIDRQGKFQIPAKFNTDADFRNSGNFSEGLAALTENLQPTITEREKYVYVDCNGAIVLLTNYFAAGPFRNGLAAVYDREKNQWGFIDKSGEILIPIQYVAVSNFSEDLAVVITLRK